MGGDNGLHLLTPFLGKLKLQVLGLEYCGLTDKSLPFVCSVLKVWLLPYSWPRDSFVDLKYFRRRRTT